MNRSYIFPLSSDVRNEMKGQGLKGSASLAARDSSLSRAVYR